MPNVSGSGCDGEAADLVQFTSFMFAMSIRLAMFSGCASWLGMESQVLCRSGRFTKRPYGFEGPTDARSLPVSGRRAANVDGFSCDGGATDIAHLTSLMLLMSIRMATLSDCALWLGMESQVLCRCGRFTKRPYKASLR